MATEKRITLLEKMMVADDIKETRATMVQELETARQSMNMIMERQVNKYILFSKTRWHLYGERNSKYFFSLAKSRYNNKTMHRILFNEAITEDPQEILKAQSSYYARLYSKDPKVQYRIKMKSHNLITQVQKDFLDEPITLHELTDALKDFSSNKSPGCDGLTAEFCKAFWPELGGVYMESLHHGIANGMLGVSCRRGILTLIPKRDRDPIMLKNWRPLSILTMCYKIFSKALDNRLKSVLHDIIDEHQTGFMSGCYILTNVLKLMQLMTDADAAKLRAIVMQIDFEKCFDTISFEAIRGSLAYFGIGEQFIKYVMLLFSDFQICTQNNGYISNWITPLRGLHQGCCISPHLFNCCGQVFSDLLTKNAKITGIVARDILNLLAQFADDTSLFLHGDDDNLMQVSNTLTYAYRNLGLKVNNEKTTIYRIGSLKNTNAKYYTQAAYAWDDPPVSTLGILVSTDMKEMARINLDPLVTNIQNTLKLWEQRDLTLSGRVLIVNTLIESKLVYRLSVLGQLNQDWIANFQKIILTYIWKGKRAKINFNVLSAPKHQGGLRLCDILAKHRALLCQWIFIIQNDTYLGRAMQASLKPPGEYMDLIWSFNLKPKHVEKLIPDSFWKCVMLAWSSFNFCTPSTYQEVTAQVIWYNSHILIEGNPYMCKQLHDAGMVRMDDLIKDNGELMNAHELAVQYPTTVSWMEYQRLISTLPKSWIRIIQQKTEFSTLYVQPYQRLKRIKKPTSHIYRELISRPSVYLDAFHRWSASEDFSCLSNTFRKNFLDVNKLTVSTKLRDFQFRLLHKRIPSNKEFFRWKIKRQPKCYRCDELDCIEHLLYHCRVIEPIWFQLILFISYIFEGEKFTFNFTEILLNKVHHRVTHISNFFVLIMKQLIYRKKCLNEKISFYDFLKEVQRIYDIELNIARTKGKINYHFKKWTFIQENTSNSLEQVISQYKSSQISNLI